MDANIALMMISDKIPSQSLPLVQEKLKNSSEDKINNIATLNFKSHIVGLILGFFLGIFGADRFYKGDIKLGLLKLLTWIIGVITIWIFIGSFILFVLWIWCIVDYFLVWKGIKKDNLKKILTALE
ncbi:TM2 domain-containing protein [Campylobacter novaezeelandiae]|uniref:TM2 domain-containing protein n=1 Tax=Campylobacter novaezeelandiae TaxID=2267891 RepID=A0A4Q9JUB2_9BACT|nr:TM2 domain-containing protein [Campylobacter novaezeelandiae]TBR78682.1 TM2 domain-containing protein [Campylobacter novaezeelandiae]TBR79745.1 TM2 domain-containing protein [Campylobacter novaezeelandiae]TBR81234.1 TM2 domain-containing protein [Campylobacter novaezeelandiae]TBR82552.1 TM2 domain-containing protein [Campylobacter novaezeelandiae]